MHPPTDPFVCGLVLGAAAWGDMNRASNPYYARLKDVLHFGSNDYLGLAADYE